MSKLMAAQREILKLTGLSRPELIKLIQAKGLTLRFLAGSVVSTGIPAQAAANILIKY